ncbi:PKD domain-containing protein [Actinoplanes oblitus]|uniref:PKD domain-containing protein n=1 Tax=Actinoplanes oblitus TaxID=3040509 RepID=A0ABY8WHA8_9ACTN|nr:PKD domain-containing protein [Actinoplanes oblitus]WIM96451.1 PKD domain-containing protein [Actinoplanes oblitus]
MRTTRSRRSAALSAVGLGALLSAGLAAPAHASGAPAEGVYRLGASSVFAGQSVTLTQLSLTGNEDASVQDRQVDWGDGTQGTMADGTSLAHRYATAGTYRVRVAITDTDGDSAGTFSGGDTVVVGAVAGTYRLLTGTVWSGPEGAQETGLALSGVPAAADTVKIGWGDGTVSEVNRTTTRVMHEYAQAGTRKVTVTLADENGDSAALAVGSVAVKSDLTRPFMTITTPSKKSKASSWRTIRGTAGDKGSGLYRAAIGLAQVRGKTEYYYNGKKWVKGDAEKAAGFLVRPAANGTWSFKPVVAPTKGYLIVWYAAVDQVWNAYTPKGKLVKLSS